MSLKEFISQLFSYKRQDPQLNNLTSGKTFAQQYNDIGIFQYTDEGFSIRYEDFFKELKWDDITELNVYKKDLFTIDEIKMEIVYGDKVITIHEELPGWHQFVLKTKNIFPTIPDDWDAKIIHPAFATNWANIYKKPMQ